MEAILFAAMAATIICLVLNTWAERKANKIIQKLIRERCMEIAIKFMKKSYITGFNDGKNFKGKE